MSKAEEFQKRWDAVPNPDHIDFIEELLAALEAAERDGENWRGLCALENKRLAELRRLAEAVRDHWLTRWGHDLPGLASVVAELRAWLEENPA